MTRDLYAGVGFQIALRQFSLKRFFVLLRGFDVPTKILQYSRERTVEICRTRLIRVNKGDGS